MPCWKTFPYTVLHSADKLDMRTKSIVDQTFDLVFTIGRYVGARLLHRRHGKDSLTASGVRKVLFWAVFMGYCFGTLLMAFLALPIPVNGAVVLKLDVFTAYPAIWGAFLLDGFACFVTINFSTKYLLDESGFVDRCRETAMIAQPTPAVLKHWRKTTRCITLIFAGVVGAQLLVTVLAGVGVVMAPVHMERVVYWSGMPPWLCWIVIGVLAAMATTHIGYHCIFFSNQCEVTRLHLSSFCDALGDEKAIGMTKRRVDLYHAEYCRLVAMVHDLDHAFRASTFCQLSLVTVGLCLLLFLFTKRNEEWELMIFIVFTLSAIIFTFLFTAVPAMLLDNQVFRPKALVRAWFLKYEKHCNVYEAVTHEQSRQALGLFMQSINAEDAGITIASLAKLNAQLLLTLASVVTTYFLVIVQLDQGSCAPNSFNVTEICTATGLM